MLFIADVLVIELLLFELLFELCLLSVLWPLRLLGVAAVFFFLEVLLLGCSDF